MFRQVLICAQYDVCLILQKRALKGTGDLFYIVYKIEGFYIKRRFTRFLSSLLYGVNLNGRKSI